MGGGMTDTNEVIRLLKEKAMTKDQLGEHFGLNIDQVEDVIEKPEDPVYEKFKELLEMMPSR